MRPAAGVPARSTRQRYLVGNNLACCSYWPRHREYLYLYPSLFLNYITSTADDMIGNTSITWFDGEQILQAQTTMERPFVLPGNLAFKMVAFSIPLRDAFLVKYSGHAWRRLDYSASKSEVPKDQILDVVALPKDGTRIYIHAPATQVDTVHLCRGCRLRLPPPHTCNRVVRSAYLQFPTCLWRAGFFDAVDVISVRRQELVQKCEETKIE
eukprot:GHVU01102960.1.p1 GENE.GHVU01102960.1~~GHVU01102960.1.p1  ORF type:complete len:211 (-),score=6.75 GHVU01102960.1:188-820(-)